jgi:hypothetical protein
VTLAAAIWTQLQGILLTAEGLGFFIAAMMLIPKIRIFATQNGTAAPPKDAMPAG